jgi:hypothetical protein
LTSGTGTQANPYQISTCEELQNISNMNMSAYYVLVNDIDCSDTKNWNYNSTTGVYEGFEPIEVIPIVP